MATQIPFGMRSGLTVPQTSIGGMRLPADSDEAVALVRQAIDSGMRYIDTSRGYGDSEIKIGRALKGGYREKVILSTKWAPWIMKIEPTDDASAACVLRRIEEQMKRLDVDYLDFYQVWNILSPDCFEQAVRPGGFVDGIRQAKDRGLVRHIGFTTHDTPANVLTHLERADWCEILLVTYNLFNRTYAPVLARAHDLGIGTIVMNPVAGGKLAEESPVFQEIKARAGAPSLADLAVRYVLSNSAVDTIISGISKPSDVEAVAASAARPKFDRATCAAIEAFVDRLASKQVRFCTACGYCMPCPQEVNIPQVMEAIYNHRYLGFTQSARQHHAQIKSSKWIAGTNASACTACGACVPKCTQQLDIPKEMAWARGTWPE